MTFGRPTTVALLCPLITFTYLIWLTHTSLAVKVLDIGDKLPELLSKHPDKSWLVKFYAPWCHHCQQLEPTYNNVAERIYHKHDHLIVGRIDCTKYGKMCEQFHIDSYPTIMYVSRDNRVKYKGDRSEDSMIAFAERLSGPDVHTVNNCDQLDEARAQHKFIVLSTLTIQSDQFRSLTRSHKHQYWFYEFASQLPHKCKNFEFNRGHLYIIKKDLNRAISFPESIHSNTNTEELQDQILAWIRRESSPIFGRVGSRNIEPILASGKILLLAILDEYKPARHLAPSSLEFKKKFEKFAVNFSQAEDNYNKFLFAWSSDIDLIEYITLSPVKTLPNVIILREDLSYNLMIPDASNAHDQRTNIPEELNEENLSNIISRLEKNELELTGGNTYLHTLLRYTLGNLNKFMNMYRANPLLVSLIFGFPSVILMFVIYTTCFYGDDSADRSRLNDDDDFNSEDENERSLLHDGHLKSE